MKGTLIMPTKTSTKSQPEIASLASTAKTADDYQALLTRIQSDLDAAETALSDLEMRRKDVVLNGEDVDAYHRDLLTAAEKVKTLTAAADAVNDQLQGAIAKEARANLEARAAIVREKSVPAYHDALRSLNSAMDAVLKVCDEIAVHRDQIEGLNELVDRKSRADLRISLSRLRADVTGDMAGPSQAFQPPKVHQMPGETDEAFELRLNNARNLASQRVTLADPIRAKAEQVIMAIQANAFEMGAHERFRNHRVINTKSFIGPYGEAVLKVQNADPTLGNPYHKVTHSDIQESTAGNGPLRGAPSSNA